jgi:NAD(P)-dependent dehydrogenase (short-subunit alcohol dehydrogenase family)
MTAGWNERDPARILVTGCSSGIGRALCAELRARGHRVIATARDASALDGLAAHAHLELDVTDAASIAGAAAAAGPVDVLINNAGISAWAPLEVMPVAAAQRVFNTNVWGMLRVSQAFLPAMRAGRRGRVINVSSAALRGYPLLGLYAASKTALEALSEAMRLELAAFGVDVVLAEPAAVTTSFGANRLPVPPAEPGEPDYEELTGRALAYIRSMRAQPLSAAQAAALIADMVELDDPPLRIPVGDDARRLTAQRHSVGDEQFERAVLSGLAQSQPGPGPVTTR